MNTAPPVQIIASGNPLCFTPEAGMAPCCLDPAEALATKGATPIEASQSEGCSSIDGSRSLPRLYRDGCILRNYKVCLPKSWLRQLLFP
jgi:hypothetical protein